MSTASLASILRGELAEAGDFADKVLKSTSANSWVRRLAVQVFNSVMALLVNLLDDQAHEQPTTMDGAGPRSSRGRSLSSSRICHCFSAFAEGAPDNVSALWRALQTVRNVDLRTWKAGWFMSSRVECRVVRDLGLASSSRPHQEDQDPRSDGRPGAPRPRRVSCDDSWGGLTANDHCHYLGMVPIDSSLSGEFSTGSVVETETANRTD